MKRFLHLGLIGLLLLVGGVGVLFVTQLQLRRFSDSGIQICSNPQTDDSVARGFENPYQANLQYVEQRIVDSTTLEVQVIGAALNSDHTNNESALESLLALSDANPIQTFPAIYAVRACISSAGHDGCTEGLIDRALASEPDNAVFWSLISSLRYRQADEFGATTALQAANTAPYYDDYYAKLLTALQEDVPLTDENDIQSYSMVIMNKALIAYLNGYTALQPLLEMCRLQVANNADLAMACLTFGERMLQDSSTLIGQMQGTVLMSVTYLGLGNVAESNRLEELATRPGRVTEEMQSAMNLIRFDQDLYRLWFEKMSESGELVALEFVIDEARRRSSDADYNPCKDVAWSNTVFKIKDFARWAVNRAI